MNFNNEADCALFRLTDRGQWGAPMKSWLARRPANWRRICSCRCLPVAQTWWSDCRSTDSAASGFHAASATHHQHPHHQHQHQYQHQQLIRQNLRWRWPNGVIKLKGILFAGMINIRWSENVRFSTEIAVYLWNGSDTRQVQSLFFFFFIDGQANA